MILDIEGNTVKVGDYIENVHDYTIYKIKENDGYRGQFVVIDPITHKEERVSYDIECRVLPATVAQKLLIKHKLS